MMIKMQDSLLREEQLRIQMTHGQPPPHQVKHPHQHQLYHYDQNIYRRHIITMSILIIIINSAKIIMSMKDFTKKACGKMEKNYY